MKIRILEGAQQDLINGFWFYERQRVGLGDYFLDSLYSDVDSLDIFAGIHPIYFSKYHRLLSKRFPFAIYYTLETRFAEVYAILDCRRNPAWTRDRIKEN